MSEWIEVGAKEAEADNRDYTIVPLKNVGDQFVGKFVGIKEKVPSHFKNDDGSTRYENHYLFERPDGKFGLNPNADLVKRLSVVPLGTLTRITVTGTKDIGKPSPMRLHKVETRAAAPSTPPSAPF